MNTQKEIIRIGDWKIIPEVNQVENHQTAFFLKPRIMRLLEYLLQHSGEIVTKDELMEAVWEDRIVTDNLLTKSISELRQILGDHFSGALEIETIRSVGYQLQCREPIHYNAPEETLTPVVGQPSRHSKSIMWVLGIGVLLAVAGAFSWQKLTKESDPPASYEVQFSPVTSAVGMEWQAAISPDGVNLAYAWRKDQSQPFYLYARHLESVKARRLTTQEGLFELNPAWSPDGQKVVFLRVRKEGFYDLYTVPLAGGEETWLATLEFHMINAGLKWSAIADQLFFSARQRPESPAALYAFDLAEETIQELTTPADTLYGDYNPCQLPDGRLAFVRAAYQSSILNPKAPGKGYICTLDQAGDINRLDHIEGEVTGLDYAPSLDRLLAWVARQEGYAYDLNAYTLTGQSEPITTVGSYRPVSIIAHPEESYIISESWLSRPDIYRLQDTFARPYLHSTHWDWHPRFSGDGQQVAFLSTRQGSMDIWLAPIAAPDQAVPVSDLASHAINWMSIAPSAEQVVLQGTVGKEEGIFLVQTKTKYIAALKTEDYNYAFPEFTPDGQSIFYASNRSGEWQIWQCNLDGKNEKMITRNGGYKGLPVSLGDSLYLYYTTFDNDQLFRMHLTTGEIHPALPEGETLDRMNFAITKQGIYYYSWQKGRCFLKCYDFTNRQIIQIRALDNIVPEVPSLAVGPDGTILVAKSDGILADLVKVAIYSKNHVGSPW